MKTEIGSSTKNTETHNFGTLRRTHTKAQEHIALVEHTHTHAQMHTHIQESGTSSRSRTEQQKHVRGSKPLKKYSKVNSQRRPFSGRLCEIETLSVRAVFCALLASSCKKAKTQYLVLPTRSNLLNGCVQIRLRSRLLPVGLHVRDRGARDCSGSFNQLCSVCDRSLCHYLHGTTVPAYTSTGLRSMFLQKVESSSEPIRRL